MADTPQAPTTPEAAEPAFVSDATISMERANVIALFVLPLLPLLMGAHWLAWGGRSVVEGFRFLFPWWFFLLFFASIVVHEALHAVGFLAVGRARRADVHFGIHRETLSPFAGCRAPLKAGAYRVAVLLPALVLGVLPAAWGLATGTAWLTFWGAFMLVSAGGDFAALWAMRAVPNTARVLDHPERVGCRVVA
ncbi:MAG TPA: DUF3267 domain-containing protein [Longimicrobium sp.]|nr:DUF3267 domain-containing protein [Longimicrobium sp.]